MKHHELTLQVLLKAMPSLSNSVNIINAILQGYDLKDMLRDKQSFGIALSDSSIATVLSRLRKFTK